MVALKLVKLEVILPKVAYTAKMQCVLIAVSLLVRFFSPLFFFFPPRAKVWFKSVLHQCHCMLHVKANLTHNPLLSLPPFSSSLCSAPVIIAFVTATIIQICLGKLLLYSSDHFTP